MMGGHDDERRGPAHGVESAEAVARKVARIGIEYEQFQRVALGMVPALVGVDPVPATDLVSGQQEVDCGQRGAAASAAIRRYAQRGFVNAAIVAALRVFIEGEFADQLSGTWMHSAERT